MNKLLLAVLIWPCLVFSQKSEQFFTRQGQVAFFSYTAVENIQATNDQAFSIYDTTTNQIAVSILMRAFKFKKSLMHEHFNESYIESDIYPKATFEGVIENYDKEVNELGQTKLVKGNFTLRNKTQPLSFKAKILTTSKGYIITGELEVKVKDYDIKIHPLISPNIAEIIKVSFNFKYDQPYEE